MRVAIFGGTGFVGGNCCDNTDLDALGIRAQRFDDSTPQYLNRTQGAHRP